MIKLAWISSYSTKCGIAEYSHYLVEALRKRGDIDVTVYGSKNYGSYKVEEEPPYVVPTFGVPPWNGGIDHSFDYEAILEAKPDIVHIQYEVVLYNQPLFYKFLEEYKGPVAMTYHDNCIPPNLPVHRFDLQYSHREDVGAGSGFLLPMGIENRRPRVKTFGLGRSRNDLIAPICERNGWDFEYQFGDDGWTPTEKLYSWLRDSDAIVLYYDEVDSAGVSIAARLAISTRRPVIVNDTTWFKDLAALGNKCPNLYVADDLDEVSNFLWVLLGNPYIEECSWDKIAAELVQDYTVALA